MNPEKTRSPKNEFIKREARHSIRLFEYFPLDQHNTLPSSLPHCEVVGKKDVGGSNTGT